MAKRREIDENIILFLLNKSFGFTNKKYVLWTSDENFVNKPPPQGVAQTGNRLGGIKRFHYHCSLPLCTKQRMDPIIMS